MLVFESRRVSELLPDDRAFADALATLPDWRRRACEALHASAARYRSVAAWLLLRDLFAARGIDAAALAVSFNRFGRPEFVARDDLHFSLSHARDRVMAALADGPVGCDVERISSHPIEVVREGLAPDELAGILSLPASERDREFCRLWVRKEAYVKALGTGFAAEPRTVSTAPNTLASSWVFRDLDFGDGYLGAVAVREGNLV